MGGYEISASLAASSSATSGIDQAGAFQNLFGGDVIAGGKKPIPSWVWLAVAGLGSVLALAFIVRR